MKNRLLNHLAAGAGVIAIMAANSISAFAADTQASHSADVNINSSRQLSITAVKDRDLFMDMKDLMPGDMVADQISITNNSGQALTFYLKAYPEYAKTEAGADRNGKEVSEAGKIFKDNLLEETGMKLFLGDQIFYDGSATGGDNKLSDANLTGGAYGVNLGTVPSGGKKDLRIEITLPGESMKNEYMDTFTAVDWVFVAQGTDYTGSDDDDDDDDNRGGGGHGGGGGQNPSGGPGVLVQTIIDGAVPLGTMTPSEDADVTIIIEDGLVPLASLAKTGGPVLYLKQAIVIFLFLLAGLAVVGHARRE